MPALARDHVRAPPAASIGPLFDRLDGLAQDPLLDSLPVAVQLVELRRERFGLRGVIGQEQLERRDGPAEPSRSVEPRRNPEPDRPRAEQGGGLGSSSMGREQLRARQVVDAVPAERGGIRPGIEQAQSLSGVAIGE